MKTASGMRLMMTTDAVGGAWIFSVTLARSLEAAGFEVHLVTIGPRPSDSQRDMLRGHRGVSLAETDLLLEWLDPTGLDLGQAATILRAISDRFAPDLIHFNGFREATLNWKVPTIVVAHSCVNSWASACGELHEFTGTDWRVYTSNIRAGLARANAWVAPTRSFRALIAGKYGSPAKGITIRNGAENAERAMASKQPFVLSAGRVWDKAKNLSVLSPAAAKIHWPVRIAGSSRIDRSGGSIKTGGCEFLGEIPHDELLREMRAAAIFVSPALYEPFGLSVLEAAGAGCALLLSDIPTFRELWDGAAVFFDPRDSGELCRLLQSLCDDEVRRARLQRAAANRARRYALQNTVRRYRELYRSLLTTNSEPRRFENAGVPA
jgi:glycosyltransferase involved in cell wall biosynthesis